MTISKSCGTRFVAMSLALFSLALIHPDATANAQYWLDDEPMEEIVVIGQREDAFAGFGSVFSYLDFMDASMNNWLEQLGNALDAAMESTDDPEVIRSCEVQQSEFRQSCLDLAHRASQACIVSGGSLTLFATYLGGIPGFVVGVGSAVTCSEANYQAVNACNINADHYTFPGANPICQTSSN